VPRSQTVAFRQEYGRAHETSSDFRHPDPGAGSACDGKRSCAGSLYGLHNRPGAEFSPGLKTRPSKCGWWPGDGFGYNSGNFRSIHWLSWASQSARATAVAYGQQTGTKYANKVTLGLSRPVTCYGRLSVRRSRQPWPADQARAEVLALGDAGSDDARAAPSGPIATAISATSGASVASAAPRSPRSTSRESSPKRSGTCSPITSPSLPPREAPLFVSPPEGPFGPEPPRPASNAASSFR
jgi:hypothetical protein